MKSIIIIGGGISSLYIAYLLSRTKKYKIYIYEENKLFGGRIKTEYSNDGKVLYETGPWRFHYSHICLKRILDELELEYIPINIPISYKGFKKRKEEKKNFLLKSTTELTEYQHKCIEDDILETEINEQRTGYRGIFNRANTTRTYSIPDKDKNNFYVVKNGFSRLVEVLVEKLKEDKNCELCTNTMVRDIKYDGENYEIKYKRRVENDWIEGRKRGIPYIIIGIPPNSLKKMETFCIRENVSMIKSLPLCHIMGRVSEEIKKYGDFKYICNSTLSQIISSLYSNEWIQISYSGGKIAELFQNLSIHSVMKLKRYIKKEFSKFFPEKIEIKEIRKYFWRDSVHYCFPNIKTTEYEMKKRSIRPHWNKYPNLYWIGESISMKQGWIEGALETSIYCYKLLEKKEKEKSRKNLEKDFVIYNGRKINVRKWKFKHPGGIKMIENHIGEDITELWNSYHSPEMSRYFVMLEEK
jgi:cytochrome b involved in lipid metabolism